MVLRGVTGFNPGQWNVHACGTLPDCLMPSSPQFNGLVYHDPVNPDRIVCDLCESWTVSRGGKTYTFRLRQAQWHDGQPVTADDIKFSLDRITEPGAIRVRTGVLRAFYEYGSAQVIDERTVRVPLRFASPLFLENLASEYMKMYPKHVAKGLSPEDAQKPGKLIGSGPWKLKEFKPNISIEYVRNPSYFKKGLPYFDGMIFTIVRDYNRRLAAMQVGQAISPYGPRQIIREADNRVPVYVAPGLAYPMGTDHVGRDVMSRIMYGARISLYVGLGAVLIGVTGWFAVGLASAYAGRGVDLVVQRIVDAMQAVPGLIIVLAIMAVLGSSLNNVVIAIIIGMLAPVVRTVRSQVLSVKEMEYVMAARAIGAPAARIVARHILPNCLATYLILATYYLGFAIILEASLSFLGVGVPPDVPSWGGMLTAAAQGHITKAPWAGIFPGLAIFLVVLGFNLLGDALRDVLEPRLRGARPGAKAAR